MRRFISVILTSTLLLSVLGLSACSKRSVSNLSECSWYKSKSYDVVIPTIGPSPLIISNSQCVCKDLLFMDSTTVGFSQEKVDDFEAGTYELTFDDREQIDSILIYDVNTGNLKKELDLQEVMSKIATYEADTYFVTIKAIIPEDNFVTVYLQNVSTGNGDGSRLESFDINTSYKCSNFKIYEDLSYDLDVSSIIDIQRINDITLIISEIYNGSLSVNYTFIKDGDLVGSVDFSNVISADLLEVEAKILNGNTLENLVKIYDGPNSYYSQINIDLQNYSASSSNDLSHFEGVDNTSITDSNKVYTIKEDGIYQYDSNDYKMNKLVDFNHSDMNIYEARHSKIIHSAPDKIVLIEQNQITYSLYNIQYSYSVHIIESSDEDPLAEKTALIVADVENNLDYATAEAIRIFNQTNPDYYVELRVYDDDFSLSGLYASSNITNRVIVDMANGDAPDIVLNGASYRELNDGRFLMDLSSFIQNDQEINDKNYFMNIIDASYIDDKIYQLPLTVAFKGIRMDAVNNNDYDFDYDEYKAFVSNVTNGYDPVADYVAYDSNKYLEELIGSNLSEFIDYDTGLVDFNNQHFIDAVNFIDSVYQTEGDELYYNIEYTGEPFINNRDAYYGELNLFYYFRSAFHFHNAIKICGLPYSINQGASVVIKSSAAISNETNNPEASWEFIKTLMSVDSLRNVRSYFPINREATTNVLYQFKSEMDKEIDTFKIDSFSLTFSDEDIDFIYMALIDEDAISKAIANLEAVNSIYNTDSDVMIVISEEIPAFFEHQKDLEEIIDIINSRITVIVNERG